MRKFAKSDPGAVDKIDRPTTKVRKCIFTEDNKDEIYVLVLSKQLGDMEKVANDEDGHLNYIKMKLKYLQRKINTHQLKLITDTSSSVTEETENMFDTYVEEALELVTTVRKIVSYRRKRMKTHKWKLGQIEFFLMRHDNEELIHFSVELIDTVEKTNELALGLKKKTSKLMMLSVSVKEEQMFTTLQEVTWSTKRLQVSPLLPPLFKLYTQIRRQKLAY